MNEAANLRRPKRGTLVSRGANQGQGVGSRTREGVSLLRMLIQFETYDGVMTIS